MKKVKLIRALNRFLGSFTEENIAFSYKDGKTYVVTTDGSSLLQYEFDDEEHENFTVKAYDFKSIRNRDDTDFEYDGESIVIRKKVIKGEKLDEPFVVDIELEPEASINCRELMKAHDVLGYVMASRNVDDVTVNFFSDSIVYRSKNKEAVYYVDLSIEKPFSISFRGFAHAISFIKTIYGDSIDEISISNNRNVFQILTKDMKIIMPSKYKPTKVEWNDPILTFDISNDLKDKIISDDRVVFKTANNILNINGVPVIRFDKNIDIDLGKKSAYFIKMKNALKISLHNSAIVFKNQNADVIFFLN